MAETSRTSGSPTRRNVVAGVGAAGLAAALVACGNSNNTSTGSGTVSSSPSEGGASSSAGGSGSVLAKTSDIPSGGGTVFADQKVVVTQPTAGEFKAFSAVCTHQGCIVKDVSGGTINCPCHGSKFKIADGSVANGPATRPLPAANIKVSGDSVTLA
ncbi:Rieske (2Fe-2S) protein [Actinacidiphila soli]|jgi:Rieske Fe-S protein|uniref:Rieske (2Fe-2S) protein n=1 Tax=Actinacidiphila soli TaxID=2487275 RepID=UPI000FC997E0|nr:Rieske (2Fe-2S) protein [Actinacidiphila soli]